MSAPLVITIINSIKDLLDDESYRIKVPLDSAKNFRCTYGVKKAALAGATIEWMASENGVDFTTLAAVSAPMAIDSTGSKDTGWLLMRTTHINDSVWLKPVITGDSSISPLIYQMMLFFK